MSRTEPGSGVSLAETETNQDPVPAMETGDAAEISTLTEATPATLMTSSNSSDPAPIRYTLPSSMSMSSS